jgi:predicted transcriptional regulator
MPAVSERPLTLAAGTAADLMRGDLASLPRDATFSEAVAFFIDRNVTVAPVVGDRGEPVGVLSLTDLLIHVRASLDSAGRGGGSLGAAAAELMTPTLFAVDARTPAAEVVRDMLRSRVHHLFVTDDAGAIVGVISTCDVLRHLH